MSNAERQRKFRQRRDMDEARRREYLEKSKQKYQSDLVKGKRKNIKDMTEREKRHQRKLWRKQKRKEKEQLKGLKANDLLSPPHSLLSSDSEPESNRQRQKRIEIVKRSRARAKCYRDLKRKDAEIERLNKKLTLYKKRWQREKEKNETNNDTPRTKTRKILQKVSKNYKDKRFDEIRKKLFESNVIVQQLKDKYKEAKKMIREKYQNYFQDLSWQSTRFIQGSMIS